MHAVVSSAGTSPVRDTPSRWTTSPTWMRSRSCWELGSACPGCCWPTPGWGSTWCSAPARRTSTVSEDRESGPGPVRPSSRSGREWLSPCRPDPVTTTNLRGRGSGLWSWQLLPWDWPATSTGTVFPLSCRTPPRCCTRSKCTCPHSDQCSSFMYHACMQILLYYPNPRKEEHTEPMKAHWCSTMLNIFNRPVWVLLTSLI